MTAYLQMWESSETGPLLKGLVRSALGSAESSPAIKETLGQHLTRSATTPSTPSLDETSAALLSTQLLGLAIGRYLLELPHLTELSTDEVIEGTAPIVQKYFDGASRTAPGTPPRKQQAQEASTQKLNKQKLDEQEQLALFDGLF
ncbi:MAG: hypothetical protein Q3974_09375 [Rothia sp. (in: high G+C Gram-positive bacteria)]|nr:hypothetical protein [Rothia sp. (in: high G+C Gram-positive bacteria)]